MIRSLVAVALILGVLAGRAGAAELTGFGPIKFGMTKEEAVAALEAAGIEGEWPVDTLVQYTYPYDQGEFPLEVSQAFKDGLADMTIVNYSHEEGNPIVCGTVTSLVVGQICNKYGVEPNTWYERCPDLERGICKNVNSYFYVWTFVFDKGAYIRVVSDYFERTNKNEELCSLMVLYRTPNETARPF